MSTNNYLITTACQPISRVGSDVGALTILNNGPGIAYVDDAFQSSPTSGRPINVGATVNWAAGSELYAISPTTANIVTSTNVGSVFDPSVIATSLLNSGLANQIAVALSGSSGGILNPTAIGAAVPSASAIGTAVAAPSAAAIGAAVPSAAAIGTAVAAPSASAISTSIAGSALPGNTAIAFTNNSLQPVLRGIQSGLHTASTTCAIPFPAATTVGDLLVMIAGDSQQITPPLGWSLIYNTATTGQSGIICYKIATPTDVTNLSATYTTPSNSSGIGSVVAIVSNSFDPVTPIADWRIEQNAANSTAYTVPTTLQRTNTLAIYCAVTNNASSFTSSRGSIFNVGGGGLATGIGTETLVAATNNADNWTQSITGPNFAATVLVNPAVLHSNTANALNNMGVPFIDRPVTLIQQTFTLATGVGSGTLGPFDMRQYQSYSLFNSETAGGYTGTATRLFRLVWWADQGMTQLVTVDYHSIYCFSSVLEKQGPVKGPWLSMDFGSVATGFTSTIVNSVVGFLRGNTADRTFCNSQLLNASGGVAVGDEGWDHHFSMNVTLNQATNTIDYPYVYAGPCTVLFYVNNTTTSGLHTMNVFHAFTGARLASLIIPFGAPTQQYVQTSLPTAAVRVQIANATTTNSVNYVLSMMMNNA